jgi:hypothetical protein
MSKELPSNKSRPRKLLYSIKETAELLSISTKSVRRLIQRGVLKYSPAFRTKLISWDSIAAFAGDTIADTPA